MRDPTIPSLSSNNVVGEHPHGAPARVPQEAQRRCTQARPRAAVAGGPRSGAHVSRIASFVDMRRYSTLRSETFLS